MTWSFEERLAYERSQRKLIDAFWVSWFGPDVEVEVAEDLAEQRRGIDVRLYPGGPRSPLAGNRLVVSAQEKIRAKDYGDVLLESVSNDHRGVPGWTHTVEADVVLYAVAVTGRAILLPGPALRRLFGQMEGEWRRTFGTRVAQNDGYRTLNVPVPLSVLAPAIDEAHGPFSCSRCGAQAIWSRARGGDWLVGCTACRPGGPSPWAIRASKREES